MERKLLPVVVGELAQKISGSKVAKIHQPAADLLLLRLWNGRQNLRLLLSVSAVGSFIQLTEQNFANPFTPPRFCQLLRARLSRIDSVAQVDGDRIVQIDASGRNGPCRLMVELIDHRANLILVDRAGKVIDSLRRTEKGEAARDLNAGAAYRLPKASLQWGAQQTDQAPLPTEEIAAGRPVEKIYMPPAGGAKTETLKETVGKLVRKERQKLCRRLENIEKERLRQKDFEHHRQQGELILTHFGRVSRGLESVALLDYRLDPPREVRVDLDPRLGPQENAERCFARYKKARRGLEHSARRLTETRSELEWLEQVAYQLDTADSAEEVLCVAAELKAAGIVSRGGLERYSRPIYDRPRLYSEVSSPNGFKVLWGKNSRQNDYLSRRILTRGDLWFHAHRCPGAHVVLRGGAGRKGFAAEDIAFAASIAAGYSRASEETKVAVMIVEPQALRKTKGSRAGMVTVQGHKIIVVQPFRPAGG